MELERLEEIVNAVQGMTYLDWQKLKASIDAYYRAETSKQNNKIVLAGISSVIDEYKHYSSTI